MSDCEKFKELSDRFAFGECSEAEEKMLMAHTAGCKKCKEELAFALNIKNTLSSLPEIKVPDNFLTSLNERLDSEILSSEKTASPVLYISLFRALKRSSALAACLVLTVTLSSGVHDKLSYNKDLVISDNVSIAEIDVTSADTVSAEQNAADKALNNSQMPVPQNNKMQSSVSTETYSDPQTYLPQSANTQKSEVTKSENNQNSENVRQKAGSNPNKKSTAKPTVKPTETVTQKEVKSESVASSAEVAAEITPQYSPSTPLPTPEETSAPGSVIPDYMDNRDNIVTESPQRSVKLDDFNIKETDALLESFSLVKIPENKAIVASPTVVESVKRAKIDTNASEKPIASANYGAGGGSLVVSSEDSESVTSILNKYIKNETDSMCMISTENYKAFINELNDNGISYRDYMIATGGANVCFKLIVA